MTDLRECPFCGAHLVIREGNRSWVAYHKASGCILSGYGVSKDELDRWDTRSPGSAMGEVREALQPFAAIADEYDRWQAKGSNAAETDLRFSYGKCRVGMDEFRRARSVLASHPASAAEGDRFRVALEEIAEFTKDEGDLNWGHAQDAIDIAKAALSTDGGLNE